jgi:hypothetical protein
MALVRTDISVEHSTSIIRVSKIGELGTMLAVTSNRIMLQRNNVLYVYVVSELKDKAEERAHSSLVLLVHSISSSSMC